MNSKGNSLVEFMAVVIILGILAAITIPNFIHLRQRRILNKCDAGTYDDLDTCRDLQANRRQTEKIIKAKQIINSKIPMPGIKCLNGEKWFIDGEIAFQVGKKDGWGDLKPISCGD